MKNLTLSPDMFTNRTNVFFFDEQIGSVEEKEGRVLAYPHGVAVGAPFYTTEMAYEFLLNMRNKSQANAQRTTLSKQQLSIF